MLENLWLLMISFGKVGLFALGGGDSMLKLIGNEAVVNRGWLTMGEYSSMLGMTFLFPGLTACKLAGLIGAKVAGLPGLIIATLSLNLPGIILTALLFSYLLKYRENPKMHKLLDAMKYGAIALIGAALFDMMRPHFLHDTSAKSALLGLALFIALEFFDTPVIASFFMFLLIYLVVPLPV